MGLPIAHAAAVFWTKTILFHDVVVVAYQVVSREAQGNGEHKGAV
jgi:hypothetical protein